MIRFRLGRIPVNVHFTHLLVSGAFALMFTPNDQGLEPSAKLLTMATAVATWVGVIFVSVLVHELGHALVSLGFGYRPVITLIWLGGNTQPNAGETIPWHKSVLLTLAGPAFGFALSGLSFGLLQLVGESESPARHVLLVFFAANLIWSVYNLLPVVPLDGGLISHAVLVRLFGKVGFLLCHALGLVVAAGVVLYALFGHQRFADPVFVAVFMGSYALRSGALIASYLRGEVEPGGHPTEAALAQAAALMQEGKLGPANDLARAALDSNPSPRLRGRAHYLLGWLSLKEAHGREALDHFAQVQGTKVEPQALAAAFSLLGEDEKALPLWELAFRETNDRTVLHEWAGALIRAGKTGAARMPGVELKAAYACAERVLFLRGAFGDAGRVGEAALAFDDRPEVAYDAGCAFARAGSADDAMRLLEKARALGFSDSGAALGDSDLSNLRNHPEFITWLQRLRKSAPS